MERNSRNKTVRRVQTPHNKQNDRKLKAVQLLHNMKNAHERSDTFGGSVRAGGAGGTLSTPMDESRTNLHAVAAS